MELCSQALPGIDEGVVRIETIPTRCRQAADLEDRRPLKAVGDNGPHVCCGVDVAQPQWQVMIDFGAWCVRDVQGTQVWRQIYEVLVMLGGRVIDVPNQT